VTNFSYRDDGGGASVGIMDNVVSDGVVVVMPR
jgi:hypothetical protein